MAAELESILADILATPIPAAPISPLDMLAWATEFTIYPDGCNGLGENDASFAIRVIRRDLEICDTSDEWQIGWSDSWLGTDGAWDSDIPTYWPRDEAIELARHHANVVTVYDGTYTAWKAWEDGRGPNPMTGEEPT